MNDTLKSIVRILEEGKPELRIAAAKILGELRPNDPGIVRSIAGRLADSESFLTPFLLEALAQIGGPVAVEALVACFRDAGGAADRAGLLLAQLGAPATRALAQLFEMADPELRLRILEWMGRMPEKESLGALVKALLSPHATLAQKAAEVLRQRGRDLDDGQRKHLVGQLQKSVTGKPEGALANDAIAQTLIVLGELDGVGSRATILRFTGPKHAPTVRQAALRALVGVPLTAAQAETVLELLDESDMTHVVRPAMQALENVTEWNAASLRQLKTLIEGEREEVGLFALRALRASHTADTARLCLEHLLRGAPQFQEAAARALGQNPAALAPLLKALHAEKSAERAQLLARPLIALRAHWTRAQIEAQAERAGKLLAAGDPLGDVQLAVLLEVAPELGARTVVEKATRLRKASKTHEAAGILMRLAQGQHLDDEGRYQLAVARLLQDGQHHKTSRGTNGDATMGWFAGLVREGFPVFDRLRREAQVTPEGMLRVGMHFATAVGPERRFGADLLQHLAEKHRRQRAGEEARLLLRSEGLVSS
jgi:hypothetical protein